jgi:very-short-patch-repair endonuclease
VGDQNFSKNHSCYYKEQCILKKLVKNYNEIKKQEDYEKYTIGKKYDSPIEQFLYEKMQEIDFNNYGYRLVPKLVFKRYTLDFALIPNKQNKNKIDIECDGKQHQTIEDMPVLEDIDRDYFLENHGWKILRFPNFDIRENTTEVINKIVENIK